MLQNYFLRRYRKRISLFFLLFIQISSLLFLEHCQGNRPPQNFILITLDTQRADFISSYFPENASTPNIDSLAKKATLFENCWSLCPITLPAHASIFFSEPPYKIKNYNNGQVIRPKRARPSFVSLFKKNGFSTAAFVSLGVLKAEFGLNENFDLYKDDFPPDRWYLSAEEVNRNVFPWLEQNRNQRFFLWIHYSDPHDPYTPPYFPFDFKLFLNDQLVGEYCLSKYATHQVDLNLRKGKNEARLEVTNEYVQSPDSFQARFDLFEFMPSADQKNLQIEFPASDWYIRREDNVFFFRKTGIISIDNKADIRSVKLTFRGKPILPVEGSRENYRKEVEYMDGEIGKLWDKLEALHLFQNTSILIVGDHGEGLGEYMGHYGNRHVGHIHFLYDVYMRVPLIIYNPHNLKKGVRKKEFATLLDIAPTVTSTMAFKKLSNFRGRDLLSLKKGEKWTIYEETYKPEAVRDRFALLHFPWHFIFTPEDRQFELFDLSKDPEEKENIYQEENLSPELKALRQKTQSFAQEVLKGKEDIKIDKKTEEMLRALGYIK